MKQFFAALGLSLSLLLSGCGDSTADTGVVSMSLTDAPTDDENVKSVFVTFTGLSYQYADGGQGWEDVDFNESVTVDLLTLQDGNTSMLNTVELPAGEISHVRFKLDTSADKCYIEFVDGTPAAGMTVPSGDQTGYKAIGSFIIPQGGEVNITADFDVRKSIATTGNGKYMLNPTIKIINNVEVGEINGSMSVDVNGSQAILYAYADNSWDDAETTSDFLNAVYSTDVTDGNYTLPWLSTGTYDLVLVSYTNTGDFEGVLGFVNNVDVVANTTTTLDISDATLEDYLP